MGRKKKIQCSRSLSFFISVQLLLVIFGGMVGEASQENIIQNDAINDPVVNKAEEQQTPTAATPLTAPQCTVTGETQNDMLGGNVSDAGDVNGDGFDDVIIGAANYETNTGRAYIFFGGPWFTGDLSASGANVTLEGNGQDDLFGWDVSGAGDINNDSYDDVIVGAPGNNSHTGAVYIFYGNASMPVFINVANANITVFGDRIGDEFGASVSDAGDVNNDDHDDVIVGAPERTAHSNWWDNKWSYREKLIFNNSGQSEALIDFPVLVNLSSANFDYSKANSNASDLRFIDADGSTELKYHIENWNTSGYSYVWVNVTNIDANSSTDHIWMYYNNVEAAVPWYVTSPNATYDSNYVGVWHLNETPSDGGAHYDSTSNDNDGTWQDDSSDSDSDATGKINGANDFDGSEDYIDLGNPDSLNNFTDSMSISGWINLNGAANTNWQSIVNKEQWDSAPHEDDSYLFNIDYANLQPQFGIYSSNDNAYAVSSEAISLNTWVYVVGIYDGGEIAIYINGIKRGSDSLSGDIDSSTINVGIGGSTGCSNFFNGLIDEVRISNKARSADWIKAQYLSMNNSFITYSAEETKEWWNGDWNYRKQLIFDNSGQTEALSNFPVLVNLSTSNFDYSRANANASDLRFIDADHCTELKYHIEAWNPGGSSYIWVNLTNIAGSSSTDYIWLYYNNSLAPDVQDAGGSYDENYVGVWHLNETGTGTRFDTTSYDNDATPGGYDGDEAITGKINGADDFDGIDDHMSMHQVTTDLDTTFTVSFWMKADSTSDSGLAGFHDSDASSNIWRIEMVGDNAVIENDPGSVVISDGNWHHIAGVADGTKSILYVDGELDLDNIAETPDLIDSDLASIAQEYDIGPTPGDFFDGIFDEVRISNIARSGDWIKAQYLSMNDSFITYNNEEHFQRFGAAYIFYGNETATGSIDAVNANVTLYGNISAGKFGFSVSGAGDVNNDSFDDVIIGAPGADRAYIQYGNSTLPSVITTINSNLTINGTTGDNFGWSVSDLKDINLDGFDDVIVGAPQIDVSWWNSDWNYRKKLTFDNNGQTEALTNFPVLINLTTSNFDYSKANSNASDLRFIDADDSTELKYHIENWNTSGYSYVWVNVTNIVASSSTDHIWMYYNNSVAPDVQDVSGTYDDNYSGVWHLNETSKTAGTYNDHFDSTSNGNDGEAMNNITMDAAGKIDGADDFDGSDEAYLEIPDSPSLNVTDEFTLIAWVNPVEAKAQDILGFWGGQINRNYELHIRDTNEVRILISNGAVKQDHDSDATVDLDQWNFVAARYKKGELLSITVNGVTKETTPTLDLVYDDSKELFIGCLDFGDYLWFNGTIDEVRVSNIARSEDWIAAQYLSMTDNFITYGSEQAKQEYYNGSAYIFNGTYIMTEGNGDRYIDLAGGDSANFTLLGEADGNMFGYSVSGAGDFNGDGFNDIIVGAPNATGGKGSAYLFKGSDSMASSISAVNAEYNMTGENIGDGFGWSVSGAGDVNHTVGYDEVIVGAPYLDDGGNSDAGKAYIFNSTRLTQLTVDEIRMNPPQGLTQVTAGNNIPITATAWNNTINGPVSGVNITFTYDDWDLPTTNNSGSPGWLGANWSLSDISGQVSVIFAPGTHADGWNNNWNITAANSTSGKSNWTGEIKVVPDTLNNIDVVAIPTSVMVGGTSDIMIWANDSFGNHIPGLAIGLAFEANPSGGGLSSVYEQASNYNATYTAGTISWVTDIVNASFGAQWENVSINVTADLPASLEIISNTTSVGVTQNATLTIWVNDSYGNGVPLQAIVMSLDDPANSSMPNAGFSTVIDNGDGSYTCTYTAGETAYMTDIINASSGASMYDAVEIFVYPGPPDRIFYVSGNGQHNQTSDPLNYPFIVKVVDMYGNPISNVGIDWTIYSTPSGATGQYMSPTSSTTNASGIAGSFMTLGDEVGWYFANAITSASLAGEPVAFSAMAKPPPIHMNIVSGDDQKATVGTTLEPLVVNVTYDDGIPVGPGILVWFNVTSGGGALDTPGPVLTNASGMAQTNLTLGNLAGPNTVSAEISSAGTNQLTFNVSGTLPQIIPLIVTNVTNVMAGETFSYIISYDHNGTEDAIDVWINDTLPSNLIYIFDTSGFTPSISGTTYSWHLSSVSIGPHFFIIKCRVAPGTLNGTIISNEFTVDYRDQIGRPMARETSNTADITVLAESTDNIPPTIEGVPDLIVRYDVDYRMDLSPYITDPDNEPEDLFLIFSDNIHVKVSPTDNLRMILNYPIDYLGTTQELNITVSDGFGSNWEIITVTITDNYPPEIIQTMPDVTLDEDTLVYPFNVTEYFRDEENDALYFIYGNRSTVIAILPNGTVEITAKPDWFGIEKVTFRAAQVDTGALVEQTINITVRPVNDPPMILPIADQNGEVNVAWTLDLSPYLQDVDNQLSELTVSTDRPQVTANGLNMTFLYTDSIDLDILTITISDGEATIYLPINVTVTGPSLFDEIMPWAVPLIIIILALLLLLYAYKRRKPIIEDAFLMTPDGLLLAHSTLRFTALDEDLFSGMLAAIQNFVEDSFTEEADFKLKKLEFGENKLVIERGKSGQIILALVYRGRGDEERLSKIAGKTLEEIEVEFGDVLKEWDGKMEGVRGMKDILSRIFER